MAIMNDKTTSHGLPAHSDPMMHHDHGHAGHDHSGHGHSGHDHTAMVADFRRRFWISMVLTVPVLALSPMIRRFLGIDGIVTFAGDSYVLFSLSAVIFIYGGWPLLKGSLSELSSRRPGMMTLITVAIAVSRSEEHT